VVLPDQDDEADAVFMIVVVMSSGIHSSAEKSIVNMTDSMFIGTVL
jgi:hypothetical protein